jgi:hypothetical protein
MSEAVKCRQGMLGMDLSELSSCAAGLTLKYCQFVRAGRMNMTKNLSMIWREKFLEVSIAVTQ